MTNDYLLYEKIDLYLKEKLSEEDLRAFSFPLVTENRLKELIVDQRIANSIVYTKQLITLQEKLQADLKNQKRARKYGKFWYIALIGILKIVVISLIIKSSKEDKVEVPLFVKNRNFAGSAPGLHAPDNSITPEKYSKSTKSIIINTKTKTPIDSLPIVTDTTETVILSPVVPITTPPIEANILKKESIPDCNNLKAEEAIVSSPSCSNEQNGKIMIEETNIKGGIPPLMYSINRKDKLSTKKEFPYLSPGTYTIYIQDANNCMISKEIEVSEKLCKKSNVFGFTPELEKWKIPVQENKQGTAKIFNKSGILVFSSDVSFDQENLWDGTSSNGQILETGYYTYKISYSDGEEEIGSVSILHR